MIEDTFEDYNVLILTLYGPWCPLVGRTNSIISNVPQEGQWAVKG